MSKNVTTMKLREGKKKSQTDWERLDALKDEDIEYSDIPELDEEFWANAKVVMPPGKKQLTLRIDEDVLAWMKEQGKGYQSRINAILRAYYETHRNEHSDRKR
jgi:uncharacterized protein (DUF4415 family)